MNSAAWGVPPVCGQVRRLGGQVSCPRLRSTKWPISELASPVVSPTAQLPADLRPDGQALLQAAHSGGISYQWYPAPSPSRTLRTAPRGSDSWLGGSEDGGAWQKCPALGWVTQAAQSCPGCGARAPEPGCRRGTLVPPEGVR